MQRRHFMKLTGMLATLAAIKGIAATSEKNRSIRKAAIRMANLHAGRRRGRPGRLFPRHTDPGL